ncbi:MAG: PilN domain-containing protein, partial [Terriglobia bacterium]
MIRINLIQSPSGESPAKSADALPFAEQKAFFPVIALVVCAIVVSWIYWSANRHIAQFNQQIAAARLEAARLSAVEAQNRTYQGQLAQINQHISVIQQLQRNRTGPQQLMTLLGGIADKVNGVYLLSVDASQSRLTIHGLSDRMNAIADFIDTLQGVPSFGNVELQRVFEDDQSSRVSFKFDLACD